MTRPHCIGLTRHFALAALMLLLCASAALAAGAAQPRAVNGQLDLRTWDPATQGPVRLSGTWEFHWGRLLTPEDFHPDTSGAPAAHVLNVPGLWQGRSPDGTPLTATGFATYRLRVLLPDRPLPPLSLSMTRALSVGRVWVNGELIGATGEPGPDPASEKPVHHFVRGDIRPQGQTLDIVIQVSNQHNVQGGLRGDVVLGVSAAMQRNLNLNWIAGACMAGALLCMFLYHMALFIMRPDDRSNLYFSLFCLLWTMPTIFGPGCGFLMDALGPNMPWSWYIDMSLAPFGLTTPLLLIFYHSLFPKKYGRVVNLTFLSLGLVFIGYILFAPLSQAYAQPTFVYFLATRLALLYLLGAAIVDALARTEGILLLAPGYLALLIAEFEDRLFIHKLTGGISIAPYGVFIFVLAYSLFMSTRFAKACDHAEKLAADLESSNDRLRQFDKLKDIFLANTTHELKTPLAGMVGTAEALLAGAGGKLESAAKEHLRVLAQSGKRLSSLVNDVLDLSRLKQQDISLRLGAVDLRETAAHVLAMSAPLANGRDLHLRCAIPEDFPPVWADRNRLEQILVNLVGNSLKFTGSGEIVISAEIRDGAAAITVSDTGIGIAKEDQERIFKAYEQLEATRDLATGGTGLGLTIAGHLAELHGGELRVESQPGEGSAFSFTLPLRDPADAAQTPAVLRGGETEPLPEARPGLQVGPEPHAPEPNEPEGSAPAGRYNVLLVDDEPVNRRVVAACLRLAGITFRAAPDGQTALRLLAEGDTPDMLLLDVMMPGLDGYAVCRELRRTHPASALPVVMLTVRDQPDDVVAGFAAGANDYLTKPFSRDELIARVGTQLKLKESYRILSENLALRTELDLRKKTEQGLRLTQLRLSRMLDSLDDAILAVNSSREIGFCNQALAALTGLAVNGLLGRPLAALLADPHGEGARGLLAAVTSEAPPSGQAGVYERVGLFRENGPALEATFFVTGIEMEDEPLLLMIVRPAGAVDGRQTALASAAMLRELNANRQRILRLEEAMFSLEAGGRQDQQAVLEDLKSLDGLLSHLGALLSGSGQPTSRREQGVRVMNMAVNCWSACTLSSKVELAEQSRIWNVYLEKDGYCRTQTLDKYLSEKTMPSRPRWRDIYATAEFVLANCDRDKPICQELAEALANLRALA